MREQSEVVKNEQTSKIYNTQNDLENINLKVKLFEKILKQNIPNFEKDKIEFSDRF